MIRHVLRAAVGLTVTATIALTATVEAGAQTGENQSSADEQLLFYNHSYGVLDHETADAIENSEFLREFSNFEVRDTVGSTYSWTGRYLYGQQTYLELFGEGDLPGQDAQFGSSAVAFSTENAGDLAQVADGLREQGIETPNTFRQTRDFGDGVRVPWFDGLGVPVAGYDSLDMWAMEYRPEYFADARGGTGPESYPGDVSRDRYHSDDYQNHQLRDITRIQVGVTQSDLDAQLPLFEAGGLDIEHTDTGVILRDGLTTVQFDVVERRHAGLRQVTMSLNESVNYQHIERIGQSTLTVGPGAQAVWLFDGQ
ncbi:DUF5829 family protein [Streptomyces mayteni]